MIVRTSKTRFLPRFRDNDLNFFHIFGIKLKSGKQCLANPEWVRQKISICPNICVHFFKMISMEMTIFLKLSFVCERLQLEGGTNLSQKWASELKCHFFIKLLLFGFDGCLLLKSAGPRKKNNERKITT